MKKRLLFIILGFFSLFVSAQINVTYTISPQTDRKVISPYVYGSNYSQTTTFTHGENFTITRDGGNRTTAYNWENNASNAGSDYIFSSDNFMCSYLGIPDANSNIPGIAYTTVVDSANKHNAKSILTLQMAGYVSRDKKGALTVNAPNSRWCQVLPKKGSAFSLNPDTTDGKVYMDEFVNFLVNKYGTAANGGVKAYALDNEPDLWFSTHKYAHPDTTRCQEIVDKTVALSSAVKAVDNTAEIYGLVSYGFNGYLNFQGAPDWNSVKGSYNWFLDYYLDKTRAASATVGKRLVDVLDLHWYPEAMGDNRICFSTANTENDKKARLQAPRTLWDPDYTENSWIGQWFKSDLPILPKIQSSIDTYNPGTKLAFTEFDYGGGDEISGGITLVDVLGIFGKYNVYASNYWSASEPITFIRLAYKMFRNYDGNNSTYGDMNIGAIMSDKENSSIYASVSQTSDDIMHVIVLNKSMTQFISGSFDMNNTLNSYTTASVYAFTSTSTAIQKLNDISITGNKFTYTLPALSVYHFILRKGGVLTPVAVTGVSLSAVSLPVNFGSTAALTATITPANATNRTVSWTSSNPAVATVSPTGLLTASITGKSSGSTVITVISQDGSITATCNVTVTGGGSCIFDTPLTSGLPGINKSFTHVYVLGNGGPNLSNLSRLVVNWDLTNKSLNELSTATNNGQPGYYVDLRAGATQTFLSAKPSLTLSGTGFPGLDGSYFVSAYNGDFVMVNKTLEFSIYFSNSATPPPCGNTTIPVTGVTVAPSTASIGIGATATLVETVLPANATNKNVTWTTSNEAIATVSATGVVTGVASGNATITVTTVDGSKTAACAVTVANIPVSGVSVNQTTASLGVGVTIQLTATVLPANATNKSVTWTTSNAAVATVSSTGLVTGVVSGNATITATTVDGAKTATCTVIISNVPVASVSVNPTTGSLGVGTTTQLTATVLPANATNKSVTWTTSNASIATVSATGLVTGVATGSATITVTTVDGAKTATCIVTVGSTSCSFGAPLAAGLPSFNVSYTKVYVLGTGPNLSNITNCAINWDLSQNGLWNLSFNTNNGVPAWWIDLRTVATWKFNQAQPEITFTNSGFTGLNGAYWVTMDGGNFALVSKTGGFAIYFSNSSTAPVCTKGAKVELSDITNAPNQIIFYPNPFSNEITLQVHNAGEVKSITIVNQLGSLVKVLDASRFKNNQIEFGEELPAGVYFIQVSDKESTKTFKIIKK